MPAILSIAIGFLFALPYASLAMPETAFSGARGTALMNWQTDDVDRVVSFTPYAAPGSVVASSGDRCLSGYQFYFDVLDSLAHNIDEAVELTLVFDMPARAADVELTYDANAGPSQPRVIRVTGSRTGERQVVRVTLPRARFAGLMEFGTDIRIAARASETVGARDTRPTFTLCDIAVTRSYATRESNPTGWLNLVTRDEVGHPTPARIGLYDATGRFPVPSSDAQVVEDFSSVSRTVLLPEGTVNWPAENRLAFYSHGSYRARLPAGIYSLVVTKGIEYRYARRDITISPGVTSEVVLDLERWVDMPARGWSAGDVHVHVPRRDARDNESLLLQAQAEDVHVTNTLVMGNIARTHFPHRLMGETGTYSKDGYALVPGQEDPRVAVRGHSVQLNTAAPVRDPSRYLLYDEVMQAVSQQGGLTGYAHLNRLGVRVGMALDALSGGVSFLEVLQRALHNTDVWFDFLNLGLRIAPAAGSDAPYGARIGDVRSYVKHVPGAFPERWFSGFAAGHTFVTNGPILRFAANGAGMGDVLELQPGMPLVLEAQASVNPDLDALARIELIALGDVISSRDAGSSVESLALSYRLTPNRSAWYVAKAYGRKRDGDAEGVVAISAPIYVQLDGQPTWKREAVRGIVDSLKSELQAFDALQLEQAGRLDEWFETAAPWRAGWSAQKQALKPRIQAALADLERLATAAAGAPTHHQE